MPHQCTGCGQRFEDGSKEMLSGCPACGGNKFQFRPKGADFPADPDPPEPDPDEPASDPGDGSVAETVGRASRHVRDFVSASSDDEPDPNASWPGEAGEASAVDPETDDGEIIDADARRAEADAGEDDAQASARSGLATRADVRVEGTSAAGSGGDTTADDEPASHRSPSGKTANTEPASHQSTPGKTANTEPDSYQAADAGRSDRPPAGEGDRVVSEPSDEDPDLTELRQQLNDQFESIKIVEPGEYELNLMELYDREEYIIALQENGRYVIQVPDQWIGNDFEDR